MYVTIANAVVITMLYFPTLTINLLLEDLDLIFIILFIIEAVIKITVLKPKKYFSNAWDRFDFVIVLASLPALLVIVFPLFDTSSLLLFRVFRLFKLFRFIQFVPHLPMILAGLGRALKSSIFVILVLLFLDLILALISCHLFREIAPQYFADPLISAYTIFQLFSVEGWNDVADAVALNISNDYLKGLARFFFVVVVLMGGIFGMSLANAIFVDEMTMDNNTKLEKKVDELQQEMVKIRKLLEQRDKKDE
jgi:voltage-gated sodium channel